MWAPLVINWFINPSNYSYLRTINHSEIGIMFTNLAPWGAPAWQLQEGLPCWAWTMKKHCRQKTVGLGHSTGETWWFESETWDYVMGLWFFFLRKLGIFYPEKSIFNEDICGLRRQRCGFQPAVCRFYDTSRGSRTWSRLLRCSGRSKNEAWPRGDDLV